MKKINGVSTMTINFIRRNQGITLLPDLADTAMMKYIETEKLFYYLISEELDELQDYKQLMTVSDIITNNEKITDEELEMVQAIWGLGIKCSKEDALKAYHEIIDGYVDFYEDGITIRDAYGTLAI